MDRGFFWTQKDKNIYSRTWELGTVSNTLSSSPSKAHKAHCPKKDISRRLFTVCHFRRAAEHRDRITALCLDETAGINKNLHGPTAKLTALAASSAVTQVWIIRALQGS